MLPGIPFAIYIFFFTKRSQPPTLILTIYSFLAFLMAIAWINWSCNCVVDLIKLFGFITSLPQALLALTVLAWGNSLGDMSADTAMTKKGFGEMAVTATMAGPIFNILMGQGLANLLLLLSAPAGMTSSFVSYSLWELDDSGNKTDQFNKASVLPLTLLVSEFGVLAILIVNAMKNNYNIDFKFGVIGAVFYVVSIGGLVIYSVTAKISTGSG